MFTNQFLVLTLGFCSYKRLTSPSRHLQPQEFIVKHRDGDPNTKRGQYPGPPICESHSAGILHRNSRFFPKQGWAGTRNPVKMIIWALVASADPRAVVSKVGPYKDNFLGYRKKTVDIFNDVS